MTVRVGINGFGRIGRDIPRATSARARKVIISAPVSGWYDNEWGYANHTIELAEKIASQL